MPLSPSHLLYTQVGLQPPPRGTRFSLEHAVIVQRCIAEHAHRLIFAAKPEEPVPNLRPRIVSPGSFKEEEVQWSKWHDEQSDAEGNLLA